MQSVATKSFQRRWFDVRAPFRTQQSAGPWDWSAFCSIAIGSFFHVIIQGGGQFFAGELLLVALFPVLLFDRFYKRVDQLNQYQSNLWRPVGVLLFALMITFLGYVISDLYRNNSASAYLRGWVRIIFIGIDILGMAMLVSIRRSNFFLMALGYGFGGVLVMLFKGVPISVWKFGYGVPITVAIIACACFVEKLKWRFGLLILLGVMNILLDYRSLGAFVIIVGIILVLNNWTQGGGVKIVGVTLAVFLSIATIGGGYIASQGAFNDRREASNSGRKASALVGFNSIMESPLIGYGSWGRDTRFAKLYADVNARMQKTEESPLYDFDAIRLATIPAHSQLLEAWIEGGMLGIVFLVTYGCFLLVGLYAAIFRVNRAVLLPLLVFFMINGLWATFMSPFKGFARVDIAFACLSAVIACHIAREDIEQKKRTVA
jgi:hypothetical protein